jgi:hypothetical protein
MADIATKYYVRRGDQEFATIASLFGGVRILKIGGMTGVGSAKNIYTASWVDSQTEDYMVAGDSVVRENVDLDITFIVGNKYGATNVREQHDAFIAYMTDGELYIKSDYTGRTLRCVSLKDYKPTTVHIKREGSSNDYIIGTISMHTLDNRAGDGDGYVANPYPSSGGSTPTPPAQQVSATNVYDAALGSTQASLNQRFENKDGELETALGGKVDKVQGKGLSSNDYTNEEKAKLAGLSNYDDTQVRQLITQTNANFANYYTKQQVDDIVDADTLHTITQQEFNEIFN